MTRLTWSALSDRKFETGLDRGVFYPKEASPVAWNGLTSVEVGAGEGMVAYYIDGRPFLYFAKPREFSATIKAFTYPDEFAAVMGLIEAADGMYLDSQVGDTFDLCYRTLVGDAIIGTEAGYRIHLIYNATVDTRGESYESLSDSVNVSDFNWDIRAVPVDIEGYRATAHVIIDTIKMDPDQLIAIETLLYGDESNEGSMPSPQTILDILNYGDTITITDNGDGTWTAEGSSGNFSTISDGIFQIDNVDAVDQGNGTYDISTTP